MRIIFSLIFLSVLYVLDAQDQPVAADATVQSPAPAQKQFTSAQLAQLVAPIALYPDSLLAQILAGATYPTDVVSAARWIKSNSSLSQSDIKTELQNKKWDPSVQGLVFFPDLLTKMNDNLDWTKDLGDAFMEQQKDVMDTIQVMRAKAKEAGTLKSDANQKVETTPAGEIQVESVNPEVVYVDNYVPSESYGSWEEDDWDYPNIMVAPSWPSGGGYGAAWALGYRCAWNNGNISHYNDNYFANANRNNANNNLADKQWTHDQTRSGNLTPSTEQIAKNLGTEKRVPENFKGVDNRAAQDLRNAMPKAAARPANQAVAAKNIQNADRSLAAAKAKDNAFASAKNSGNLERAYSDRGASSRAKSPSVKNRPNSSVSHSSGARSGASRGGGGGGGRR